MLLLLTMGCSLTRYDFQECTEPVECRAAFGFGHTCGEEGYCAVVEPPGAGGEGALGDEHADRDGEVVERAFLADVGGGEIDEERDLAADDVFGSEVFGDAADDCAGVEARVDGELQKLVGFGNLFAFEDGADAEVEFGEVVEGDFVFGRHEVAG